MAEEKIITINLRKELTKVPKWKKAKQAMKILKKNLKKQTKSEVKLDKNINEKIWSRSIENPPTKLRVKIIKVDEKSFKAELIK